MTSFHLSLSPEHLLLWGKVVGRVDEYCICIASYLPNTGHVVNAQYFGVAWLKIWTEPEKQRHRHGAASSCGMQMIIKRWVYRLIRHGMGEL